MFAYTIPDTMMNKTLLLLSIVCGAPLLTSCSTPVLPAHLSARVEPGLFIRNSDGAASGFYQLGRRYQEQNRLEQAAGAYQRAIGLDSGYLEARNALAVVYAAQGKSEEAIAQFNLILNAAPRLAHVHNNLGYTYYLKGSYAAAIKAFDAALAIEPHNQHAQMNRGRAYRLSGDTEKSDAAFAAAGQRQNAPEAGAGSSAGRIVGIGGIGTTSVPAGTLTSASIALTSGRTAAAFSGAAAAEASTLPSWSSIASVDLTGVAGSTGNGAEKPVAETDRQLPPAPTAARAESIPEQSVVAERQRHPRIEIGDSTSVAGLADEVAQVLIRQGLPAPLVAPQPPRSQRRTVILYRDGFHDEAVRLSRSFLKPPALVNNSRNRPASDRTDLRLLLGSEAARDKNLFAPDPVVARRFAGESKNE